MFCFHLNTMSDQSSVCEDLFDRVNEVYSVGYKLFPVFVECTSDAVFPDELLGDGTLGNITQFFQEGSIFKVVIHAVAKAGMTVL